MSGYTWGSYSGLENEWEEPEEEEQAFPVLFECYNCGYMFGEEELNYHHLCQACAGYLGEVQS